MGVDYQARKAAKRSRKNAEELKPRRERKKKGPRRLCRGTCYQEPGLTAEDLAEGQGYGPARHGPVTSGGELARSLAHFDLGGGGGDAAAPGSKRKRQEAGAAKAQSKAKRAPAAVPAASDPAAAGKKPRLSTAVNLLDARKAKTEAPRAKAAPGAAVGEQLRAFPDLIQRFMAGEG